MNKPEDHEEITVGDIGAYYGCLNVRRVNGSPEWAIQNWDGFHWEPIPEYLYRALMKHEAELEREREKARKKMRKPQDTRR